MICPSQRFLEQTEITLFSMVSSKTTDVEVALVMTYRCVFQLLHLHSTHVCFLLQVTMKPAMNLIENLLKQKQAKGLGK